MKKFLTSKLINIILSSFIAALIALVIRYTLFFYFNLDVLSLENPYISFIYLFDINVIRWIIRHYLEESLSQPLNMNIEDLLNPESPKPSNSGLSQPRPGSSQVGPSQPISQLPPVRIKPSPYRMPEGWTPPPVPKPIAYEDVITEMGPPVFRIIDGKYSITDPKNTLERGYVDPETERAYIASSQPFCRNLALALAHEAKSRNLESAKFNWEKFDPKTEAFIRAWMFWNHNPLPINGPWNCDFVRRSMIEHR